MLRRIHSASTIAAASMIAGHTGAAVATCLLNEPISINTTPTSTREMTCTCRYIF